MEQEQSRGDRFNINFGTNQYKAKFNMNGNACCRVDADEVEIEYFRAGRASAVSLPFDDYYLVSWALRILGSDAIKESYPEHFIPLKHIHGKPPVIDESYGAAAHKVCSSRFVLFRLQDGKGLRFSDGEHEVTLERRQGGAFYFDVTSIPTPLAISIAETILADEFAMKSKFQLCLACLKPEHECKVVDLSPPSMEEASLPSAPRKRSLELSPETTLGLVLVNLRAALEAGPVEISGELAQWGAHLNALRPLVETTLTQIESLGLSLPECMSQTALLDLQQKVEEREASFGEREAGIAEREVLLEQRKGDAVSELEDYFSSKMEELAQSAAALTQRSLDARVQDLDRHESSLKELESMLGQEMRKLDAAKAGIERREHEVDEREAALERTKSMLAALQQKITR